MIGNLLLVEGKQDKYVIERIYHKTFEINPFFEIEPYKKEQEEGISALLRQLPLHFKIAEQGDIFGLVVDADLNEGGRWQRISQILIDQGYTEIPTSFDNGLILPGTKTLPRFGLWIMPNNRDTGILEDFIQTLIIEGDQLLPVIENTLEYLKQNGIRLFTDAKKPKAFINTWLAWQENPGLSFGSALNNRLLTIDAELCVRFTSWLKHLYSS